MKEFFKGFIKTAIVLVILGCAVAGGVIGNGVSYDNPGFVVLGLIAGLVAGIVISTTIFGLALVIISIDDNLEILKNKLVPDVEQLKNTSEPAVSTEKSDVVKTEETSKSSVKKTSAESSAKKELSDDVAPKIVPPKSWVCTKCGASNPIGAMLCQSCGH